MTITLDLSETVSGFVREQTRDGAFGSEAEYIKALLEAQRVGRRVAADPDARRQIAHLVQEGIDSGAPTELKDADWSEIERQVFGSAVRSQ